MSWRIGLGADNLGLPLKDFLKQRLESDERVAELLDYGVREDTDETAYPHVGLRVAEAVAAGEIDRAILVCGTGIGMAITANKVRGVRATVGTDGYSVERSVLSNNCQVLCFGARVVGHELAAKLTAEWLGYVFDDGSPSQRKVAVISGYEERIDE
jgi:ribose 5-phosphate isomerase B